MSLKHEPSSEPLHMTALPPAPGRWGARCRANLEQISQSGPDSGLGVSHFQRKIIQVVPSPLASGVVVGGMKRLRRGVEGGRVVTGVKLFGELFLDLSWAPWFV